MSLLDLEESMQRRTEKILLAECSQIYKDLSMSKAFATAEDFADCVSKFCIFFSCVTNRYFFILVEYDD